MSKKRLVLEFTFKEKQDEGYEDWTYLDLVKIERTHSDLSDSQIDSLGEDVAQTDEWQINRWIDIQTVLGNSSTKKVKIG